MLDGLVFMAEIISGLVMGMLVIGWLMGRSTDTRVTLPETYPQCAHCGRYRHPDDLMWEDDQPVCVDTIACSPRPHPQEAA